MSPLSTPHNTPPPPLLSFSCERPSKRRSAHFSILGTPCTYHAINPSVNPKRFRVVTRCGNTIDNKVKFCGGGGGSRVVLAGLVFCFGVSARLRPLSLPVSVRFCTFLVLLVGCDTLLKYQRSRSLFRASGRLPAGRKCAVPFCSQWVTAETAGAGMRTGIRRLRCVFGDSKRHGKRHLQG